MDPAVVAPIAAVRTWSRQLLLHPCLEGTNAEAWHLAVRGKLVAEGPVTAVINTLAKIGWRPLTPRWWLARDRRTIDAAHTDSLIYLFKEQLATH
eukprot:3129749-Lingulodinium_polyedra.AAC.1